MDLSSLKPNDGAVADRFRVGRGHGSGNGKTSGRGQKGQKSRSGGGTRPGFEGGQMPLYRRIPKRGFTNYNHLDIVGINVSALNIFEDGAEVTVEELIKAGLVKNPRDGVKILGDGEITKKLTVKGLAFTASAKEKIETAGGNCEVM
ncbi:MAG: 50S ribosomal protein L15 [Clostridiales bacterium]|nr:50S ribosomal protein L15 [Clostridiales bacterium]MBS5877942.1 50S ribosomal protein L15 [Clostridiales bacterium]MDU0939939.1 50S ribosomal protein L15 [Clostridiales bacterium]MDU1042483.1 50S ribosomal protein L15 [Clostridiales bacterium]MDU3489798.1 50S ribosomal protein L15 [Clostridiales bacterium]